jgi:hypothetical protein
MARRVVLWSTLARGELVDAARASSRTRLPDLPLTPEELAATHAARATLGHAIREARLRKLRGPAPARVVQAAAVPIRKSRRAIYAVAGAVGALLLGWLLLVGLPNGPFSDQARGGARGGAAVAVAPLAQSRGRTTTLNTLPPIAQASAVPTIGPVSGREAPDPDNAANAGGAGGAGGQGGAGVIGGPAFPGPTPTLPPPTGYTRFHGRVVDTAGIGIPGVCVVIGSLNCDSLKPHTDTQGFWNVLLTSQPYWDFTFEMKGYRATRVRQYAYGEESVLVPDVRLGPQ